MKDANEILLIWRLGEMGRLRDCALPKAGNRPSRSDWIRPHLAGDLRVPTEPRDGFTDSRRFSTNSAARCDGHHEPKHRWVSTNLLEDNSHEGFCTGLVSYSSLHPSQIPTNLAQSRRRKGPLAPYAVLLAQLGRLRPFSLDDLAQSSSVL